MQFDVTSINYVSSGNMEKMLNIDLSSSDGKVYQNKTFLTHVEDSDDSFIANGNANKFSIKHDTTLIHNLYDIRDVCLKSNIVKVKDAGHTESNKSDKFVDIYAPSTNEDPIQFIQLEDTAYVLSERTTKAPKFLRTDLIDQRNTIKADDIKDKEYKFKITGDDQNTYIYSKPENLNISANYQAKVNLKNIGYNYIYEIPHNANDFNDFDEGDIQAEILQTKNAYDSMYKMNMPDNEHLINTRYYEGIGVCGDKVFLKYRDSIDYSGKINKESDISSQNMLSSSHIVGYQKIETIDSINRFRSNTRHKSNLFSIALRNTGLNPEEKSTAIKDKIIKIQNDIKNNIREMVKKVCPVESQLFDVYFEGD